MAFNQDSVSEDKQSSAFRDSTAFLDRPYCGPFKVLSFGKVEIDAGGNKWNTYEIAIEITGEGFEGLRFNFNFQAPNLESEYYNKESHEDKTMFMSNHWLFYFSAKGTPDEREKWAKKQINVPEDGSALKQWAIFMKQFHKACEKVDPTQRTDLMIKILGSTYTGSPRLSCPYYPFLGDERSKGNLAFTAKEREQNKDYIKAKDQSPTDPDDIKLDDDDKGSVVDDLDLDDSDF